MKNLTCALLCGIGFLSLSCSEKLIPADDEIVIPEMKEIRLSSRQYEVLNAGKDFNFELFHRVADKEESVFISPLSLQIALSMAANGASGTTFKEMAEVMGYGGCSIEDINSMYRTLIAGLGEVDTSTTLEIANSAWVNGSFPLRSEYVSQLDEVFDATCRSVDFSTPGALAAINGWCSDKTHGMIPSIFDSLAPEYQFILLNALYFKGIWAKQFDAANTVSGAAFKAVDGTQVRVDMMHQTEDFNYSADKQAEYCALPFGNTAFELDIILPREGVDFKKYVSSFNAERLQELKAEAGEAHVTLSVPKLELNCFTGLVDILKDMGITTAFSDGAQFPYISEISLKIAEVRQKAAFKMDEKGAKAAAVTGIAFEKTSIFVGKDVVFTADRPFILLIRECTSGAILFLGTYTGK